MQKQKDLKETIDGLRNTVDEIHQILRHVQNSNSSEEYPLCDLWDIHDQAEEAYAYIQTAIRLNSEAPGKFYPLRDLIKAILILAPEMPNCRDFGVFKVIRAATDRMMEQLSPERDDYLIHGILVRF